MHFPREHEFTHTRAYRGPVRCVIFDWAGTTLDFGCMAPAKVFCEVFEKAGVPISMEEARIPMGAHKKTHIAQLCEMPGVRRRWREKHGAEPNEKDVEKMFADFVPMQEACLSEHAKLIPGTPEVIKECRRRECKIGSTTGYLQGMLKIIQAEAKKQGYVPDAVCCAGDVPRGRPRPHMVLRNMLELDISPVQAVVKVDDTMTGIEEGLNAGAWAIGLAASGNEVGVPFEEWSAFPEEVKQKHRARVYPAMYRRGAHYVIDSIADLVPCLDDIEARLRRGEKP